MKIYAYEFVILEVDSFDKNISWQWLQMVGN